MNKALHTILVTGAFLLLLASCTERPNKEDSAAGQTEQNPISKVSDRKAWEFNRVKDPITGEIPVGIRAAELKWVSRLPKIFPGERGLGWERRGPFNIGGRTRALALDYNNEDIIIAGGVTGGMWRSENGGESWVKTTNPAQIHSVSCVVQDTLPGRQNIWYYGTGEEGYGIVSGTSFSSRFSGDGIFKSTDGGMSWQKLEATASGTPQTMQDGSYDHIWQVVVDHTETESEVILAAVMNGVLHSTDGGESWEEVLGFNPSQSIWTDLMQTPSGVFYAVFSADGLGRGVFRSEDGVNWTELDFPMTGLYRRLVMDYNPFNDNEIYILVEGPSEQNDIDHALWKYTYMDGDGTADGGLWEERSGNLPLGSCELDIGVNFEFETFNSQGSYNLCIAHHPTVEDVIFIGGRNVFRSTNAFTSQDETSWIGGYRCNVDNPRDYTYPNHHSDQHAFVFGSASGTMFSANDGGVQRTDDCFADSVIWTSLNNGFLTSQFYTVAMEQGTASSDFVMGGMQDNGSWATGTVNFEDNWKEVHNDDGAYCAIPEGMDFVVCSSQRGRIYIKQLDENGNIINARRINDESGPPNALFINPFLLDPVNHNELYVAAGNKVWRTQQIDTITLNGDLLSVMPDGVWQNWSPSFAGFIAGGITSMDKPKIDHSIMYMGTDNGKVVKITDIYGEGADSEIVSSSEMPPGTYVGSVAANDLDRDEVLIAISNYNTRSIWHSLDGGGNWQDVSGNLEENPDGSGAGPAVYTVEIYPSDPPVYFAGTSAGLFSTDNLDGQNTIWSMEGSETIGNVVINMVKARPYDGTVAVATHANGIYSTSLEPVTAVQVEETESAPEFALTAYPNPFVESVQFKFQLNSPSEVELEIRDLQGKLIHRVNPGALSVGLQELSWACPQDLEAGIYTYRLKIDRKVRTGKIMHIKR